MQNNKDVVLKAVENDGQALAYASSELHDNDGDRGDDGGDLGDDDPGDIGD